MAMGDDLQFVGPQAMSLKSGAARADGFGFITLHFAFAASEAACGVLAGDPRGAAPPWKKERRSPTCSCSWDRSLDARTRRHMCSFLSVSRTISLFLSCR